MTVFPITLTDISLYFAVMSVILFATSELISPTYGRTSLVINKLRLRKAAWWSGALFLLTTLFEVIQFIPRLL